VPTCPDAIADWLTERTEGLERVGMETGPLAVWLWNALTERQVPIVCMDARHASGVLGGERHLLPKLGWPAASGLGKGDCRENRAAQGQGGAGPEIGRHPARHVAHQHALPGGRDGVEPEIDPTLIFSATERVQPGRAARVRSLPGLRARPRTPLRSTRP